MQVLFFLSGGLWSLLVCCVLCCDDARRRRRTRRPRCANSIGRTPVQSFMQACDVFTPTDYAPILRHHHSSLRSQEHLSILIKSRLLCLVFWWRQSQQTAMNEMAQRGKKATDAAVRAAQQTSTAMQYLQMQQQQLSVSNARCSSTRLISGNGWHRPQGSCSVFATEHCFRRTQGPPPFGHRSCRNSFAWTSLLCLVDANYFTSWQSAEAAAEKASK